MSATKKTTGSRMSTGLVALGSAAVFAVYSAGYLKTQAAAARLNEPRGPRRSVPPVAAPAASPEAAVATPAASAPGTLTAMPAPASVTTLALPTTPANRVVEGSSDGAGSAPTPTKEQLSTTSAVAAPPASTAPSPSAPAPAPASATTAVVADTTPVPVATAAVATPVPGAKYKDGTYTGWGSCRHGDIQAQVVVTAGRIVSAEISQCLTRYSCSWISPLPPQVTARQSPEVDYVSGATQSATAFYDALVDALSKAK